ncbi:hypothetical protein J4467_03375 [Candidatus Woesearchaeota archaeon]|nr:hypothetical protein [Candidatus Woesearchaeota archaeon]
MRKRGQFTLFVIVGLLVVSVVMLGVYYKDEIFASQWEKQRAESLVVPEQAEEFRVAVDDCIDEVSLEALKILGLHGGYIEIPADSIAQSDLNPFSNSLEIIDGTDFETAYWFYIAANNVQKEQVPTIESMQTELGTYVSNNLARCIDEEIYTNYNATVQQINTDVEIQNEEVLFTVTYPITIAMDDFSFKFENFYISQDVPLGKMYGAASQIMDEENSNFFLEELSYDSLMLYEEVPLSWTEFDCDRDTWDVSEVEESLQEILVNNMFAIKLRGTDYEVNNDAEKKYFEWSALNGNFQDYNVNVYASQSWPFTMQVSPVKDGELKEDTINSGPLTGILSSLFCMTSYNFVYDIKYPVLLTMYDSNSNYRFQFAVQVVLDNNQPRVNELGLIDFGNAEETLCVDAQTSIDVYVSSEDYYGYLNAEEGVTVSLQCITSKCEIGTTDGNGDVFGYVPQCVNGVLIAEKDGYVTETEIVTTIEDVSESMVIDRLYNLSYEIMLVDDNGNVFAPTGDDTVFVTLTSEDYTTTVYYPSETDYVLLKAENYAVEGKVVSSSSYSIDFDPLEFVSCTNTLTRSVDDIFGLGEKNCEILEFQSADFDSTVSGGVDTIWSVDVSDLEGARKVTFYVASPGVPENAEELEEMMNYIDAGLGSREPELS